MRHRQKRTIVRITLQALSDGGSVMLRRDIGNVAMSRIE